ncbi:MAG: threonylcarbamoyl-AMP synthase [Rickettsiales bacterium]|nr:threonylcarbamoyl-AMP synthase [Rickettsiales bacterium]
MIIIKESDPKAVELACEALRTGKIISFATDTVYGLAVDACNFKAVEALFALKKRDQNKPVAIFLKDLDAAKKIFYFDETAEKIAEKFFTGSLTLVLETKPQSSSGLASNLNLNDEKFLGFRIVNRDFVKDLLDKFDGILAVTSANPSAEKAAISAAEVEKYFTNSSLDLLVDSSKPISGTASTVIRVTKGEVQILRP